MKSQYIKGKDKPDFDARITEIVKKQSFDGGGNTMVLAIENREGDVYRVLSVTGLSEYMGAVNALLTLGFADLLAQSPTSREGYDSRMRPDNVAVSIETDSQVDWTDAELDAAVDAYLWMLHQEEQGEPYNKSEVNTRLRESPLARRTKASIEFRMQNISATLEDLCAPRIKGYLPAKNVGEGVKRRIEESLARKKVVVPSDYRPTEDDKKLLDQVKNLRKRRLVGIPKGSLQPAKIPVAGGWKFVRDPLVVACTLERACGKCEGCNEPAPFEDADGLPFLEVHHVLPLARGGSDRVSNTVALCPNCHRRAHYSKDRESFTALFYRSIPGLEQERETQLA